MGEQKLSSVWKKLRASDFGCTYIVNVCLHDPAKQQLRLCA